VFKICHLTAQLFHGKAARMKSDCLFNLQERLKPFSNHCLNTSKGAEFLKFSSVSREVLGVPLCVSSHTWDL